MLGGTCGMCAQKSSCPLMARDKIARQPAIARCAMTTAGFGPPKPAVKRRPPKRHLAPILLALTTHHGGR
jgi:hypothetical protein